MRRYSKGGVVQQRGRWKGLWYEDGVKRSRIVGLCKGMTKTEARQAVEVIIAKLKPQSEKPLMREQRAEDEDVSDEGIEGQAA